MVSINQIYAMLVGYILGTLLMSYALKTDNTLTILLFIIFGIQLSIQAAMNKSKKVVREVPVEVKETSPDDVIVR